MSAERREDSPARACSSPSSSVTAVLGAAISSALLSGCGGLLPAPAGERHESADGRRVAVVDGGRLIVDGAPHGPSFDAIGSNSVRFSPAGDRLAYLGTRGPRIFLVVDGQEHGPFADVSTEGVRFSPRGKHVTVQVRRFGKWHIWMEGREFGPYEDVARGHPLFSDDDQRFAYAARHGGTWAVWFDGMGSTLGSSFVPGSIGFMANRQAYFPFQSPEGWRYRIGQRTGDAFPDLDKPGAVLSPDGKSVAYIGRRGKVVHVCVDQQCGPPHRRVGQWSPDGTWNRFFGGREWRSFRTHVASLSRNATGKVHSVITDAADGPYANVGFVVFSPDSRHHAYLANDDVDAIVIDGAPAVALPAGRPLEWMRFDDSSQALMYRLAGAATIQVVEVPYAQRPEPPERSLATATLQVTASHPDALVFVDGRYEGLAPLDVKTVPGGRRIEVQSPGRTTRRIEVDAVADRLLPVDGSAVVAPVRAAIEAALARADASEISPASGLSETDLMRTRLLTGIPVHEEVLGVVRSTSHGNLLVIGETALYGFDARVLASPARRGAYGVPYEELVRLPVPTFHPLFEIALTPKVAVPVASLRPSMSRLLEFKDGLRAALQEALSVVPPP